MADLLVSVRSVAEARAALKGRAGLVDIKEPSRGSLGRADDRVIAGVLRFVRGRRAVSAALGELLDSPAVFQGPGLGYAKCGLAGCGRRRGWRQRLADLAGVLARANPSCRLVAVAYADWRRAVSPSPEHVCEVAADGRPGVLLLDTWRKDGTTLLDWLARDEIGQLTDRCRAVGVRVALAGSLGPEQICLLRPVEPDWFAVRGAVCRAGNREGPIDPEVVRRLAELVAGPFTAATPGG
jgi:uncharacterized protein (UPF0264 family)